MQHFVDVTNIFFFATKRPSIFLLCWAFLMPLGWDIPILESNQNLSYFGPGACYIIVIYGCILHFWNHLHTFAVLCSWNVFVYDHETFKFANNFFIYFIFRKLTCLFTYLHMNLLLQNKFNVNNEIFLFGFSYDSSLSSFNKCEIIL